MEIFPLDIATGRAFCNRTQEIARLTANIDGVTHTLIMAPRRMGKTSLVIETLSRLDTPKLIPVHLDLMLTSSPEAVQQYILRAVGEAITEISPIASKLNMAGQQLKKALLSLRPKIEITDDGFKIHLEATKPPVESISDALTGLDELAHKHGYRVVFYMDEFQQLAEMADNETLEGAIRHAAQHARATAYIFTGSNRHMLSLMFDDSARPLYHLCDKIVIERIEEAEYSEYLQKQAKKHWNKSLSESAFLNIMAHTQRHPYYVNVLCRHLWHEKNPPSEKKVSEAWRRYVQYERGRVISDINKLSNNQREMLILIANNPTDKPYAEQYLSQITFARGSARGVLKILLEQDYVVYGQDGVYRLQDPVIETYICQKQQGSTLIHL
ncbi:MAG: ATP-binding protein [gamma proteobacterium symbiont of Clathrolucina costata]